MKRLLALAPLLSPISLAALAPNALAQVAWVQSPSNGHWYTTELADLTWCGQEALAQSYGGHLATVRDQTEQTWIWATFGGPGQSLAVGAFGVGTWAWTSGEPFDLQPNNPNGWNPWGTGEPNNSLGLEDRAVLMEQWGGQWNDYCGCCGPDVPLGLIELVSDDCNQNLIPDTYELAVGAVPDCDANGIPDSCDIASGTTPDPNGNGIPEQCESSITTYCSPAAPNSVSATGSHIAVQGIPSTLLNNLVFTVSSLPVHKPGLFIYAPFQNHLPVGDGWLCIGGVIQRVQPAQISSPQGTVDFPADLTQFPFTGGVNTILPGSTWNFQFWHRDPIGGLHGFNFSDAVQLTFAP